MKERREKSFIRVFTKLQQSVCVRYNVGGKSGKHFRKWEKYLLLHYWFIQQIWLQRRRQYVKASNICWRMLQSYFACLLKVTFFCVHFHLLKLKLCFYNLLCRFWVLAFRVLHKKEFMYIHVYMVKQLRFTLSDVYEEQVKIWWANINYFVLKSLSEKRNFFPQKLTINLACCAPTNQPSIHIASWKYETMYVWAYAMCKHMGSFGL